MNGNFVNFEFIKENEFFIFNSNEVLYIDSIKKENSYIVSIGLSNGVVKSLEFNDDDCYLEAKRKIEQYFNINNT